MICAVLGGEALRTPAERSLGANVSLAVPGVPVNGELDNGHADHY